jgi:lipopolysaccharide export system protein LptA
VTRRTLEVALVLFGAAFLAVVFFSFRSGRQPRSAGAAHPIPAARDAGPATTLSSGFDFTESVRGRPIFRIKAKKTAGFGAGPGPGSSPELYAGEGITLTVYPDSGAPVTVESERAEYDARSQRATLEGNVRWTDGKGALAESGKVAFESASRVITAPGAVHFAKAGFDLNARGATYDAGTRVLRLAGPVEGEGGRGALARLRADSGLYREGEGSIELEGGVHTDSGAGDRLECHSLTLKLSDPGGHPEWARASGDVKGVVGAGRTGTAESVARNFTGETANFVFDDAGEVRSLTLTGQPAAADELGRRVTAKAIDLEFAGRRAGSARARGDVAIASGPDKAFADQGDLSFGADGAVEGVTLSGSARLDGEGRSGRADRAVQVVSQGIWVLTGDAHRSASVEQSGSRVSAPRIEIDDRRKIVRAEGGGARAVLAPSHGDRANATIVGDSTRPTFAKAERMVFDDGTKTATLSGGAALWQEASSLFGRDITVNDSERSVVATGNARALLAPDPAGKHPEDKSATVLTADRLIYRESRASAESGSGSGEATLEGNVQASRGTWRANGQSGKVLLAGDRKVERVELSGDVSVSDAAAGRTGRAERAVDRPEEGRTVLEGNPAVVTDRDGSRVAGAILTLTERGRRVEVTAPEGGQTQTIHPTRQDR